MLRFATILLFLSVTSFAAPVIEASAYCRVGATVVQSDFDCNVGNRDSWIDQDLTWELGGGIFSLKANQDLVSHSYTDENGRSGETIARLQFSHVLTTTGPERPGFLRIDWDGDSYPPREGEWFIAMSVDQHSLTHPEGAGNLALEPYRVRVPGARNSWLLPFTLGTAISITYDGSLRDRAPLKSMAGTSSLGTRKWLDVRVLEADGTTLAALTEIPEPSTAVLVTLAMLVAGRQAHRNRFREMNQRIVGRSRR